MTTNKVKFSFKIQMIVVFKGHFKKWYKPFVMSLLKKPVYNVIAHVEYNMNAITDLYNMQIHIPARLRVFTQSQQKIMLSTEHAICHLYGSVSAGLSWFFLGDMTNPHYDFPLIDDKKYITWNSNLIYFREYM